MEYEKACTNCYYGTEKYKGKTEDRCSICKDTPNLSQWRPLSKLKVKRRVVKVYCSIVTEQRALNELPCHGCIVKHNLNCIDFREHMVDKGFEDCDKGLKHFYIVKNVIKRKPKDFEEGV